MKQRAIVPYAVGVGFTLVLLLAAYVALFLPRIHDTQALSAKTAQQASANAALESKIGAAKAQASSLGSLRGDLADFQKAFPAGASQEDLIQSIMAAAASVGVNVSGISPTAPSASGAAASGGTAGPAPQTAPAAQPSDTSDPALAQVKTAPAKAAAAAPTGALASVGITLSASGSPQAVQQFVKALEQMPRPILVKSITLATSGGKGNLSLVGTTWFSAPLPEPKAPTGE